MRCGPRIAALALVAATAAGAQEGADRARLEDFALPQAEQSPRVDQLSPAAAPIEQIPAPVDRSIAAPEREADPVARPSQLSSEGDSRSPTQLSSQVDRHGMERAAISSRTDSTPGSVVRLRGRDRCDPQLDRAEMAECLRILELRADEFDAPAPPRLSAEEKLLAEQFEQDERLFGTSGNLRLRQATMTDPDADLQSNQEIASIYLEPPAGADRAPAREEEAAPSADVGEVLKALGLDQAPPPQN